MVTAMAACASDGGMPGPMYRCQATDASGTIYTADSANAMDASDRALQQCQYGGASPTTCQSTRCTNTW
jgi:hypothetical protein